MRKKKLKARIEELEVELKDAIYAKEAAENKANDYRSRFETFGSNVETVENLKGVKVLKWSLKPQPWGTYATYINDSEPSKEILKKCLADRIAKGLIENNVVQFIDKPRSNDDPLSAVSTMGAKLFVIPWEQVPHTRFLEVMQKAREEAEE